MSRYVYNVYPTFQAAEREADKLVEKGVPDVSISLVAKNTVEHPNTPKYDFIPANEVIDNRNWFHRAFDLDTEEKPRESQDFTEYSDALDRNQVLLIVDGEFEGILNEDGQPTDISTDEYPGTVHDDSTKPPGPGEKPLVDDALTGEAVSGGGLGLDGRTDPLTKPDSILDADGDRPK